MPREQLGGLPPQLRFLYLLDTRNESLKPDETTVKTSNLSASVNNGKSEMDAKSHAGRQPMRRRRIDLVAIQDEGVRRYAVLLQERVKRRRLDPGSAHAYLADVAAYAAALAQSAPPCDTLGATPADAADYFERLVAQVSPSTARRKLASLRSLYAALEQDGLVSADPTSDLQPPPLRRTNLLRKPIQASVMKKLLATPTQETAKGLRDRALLILLALYGLPVIEVHRLNVSDVDLRAARLRVVGRGGKARVIELAPGTLRALEQWLTTRAMLGNRTAALFVSLHWTAGRSEPHDRLSVRGIRAVVDSHLRKAHAKDRGQSCHSLRRSCAALAVEAGADPGTVARFLGRATVASIQDYIDRLPPRKGEAPAHYLADLLE
jgi:site-specific recombinase XerD